MKVLLSQIAIAFIVSGEHLRCGNEAQTTSPPASPQTTEALTDAPPDTTAAALNIPDGTTVRCTDNADFVYRYTDGGLRFYPSGAIAATWDSNWWQPRVIDCTGLKKGPNMEAKPQATEALTDAPPDTTAPALNIPEGTTVRCTDNADFVYRYTDGGLRFYPSGAIAATWDSNWWQPRVIDCTGLKKGPNMEAKP